LGWCFVRVSGHHGYWLSESGTRELSAGQVVVLSPLRDGYFRASQLGPTTLHHFRFSPELEGGVLTADEHDLFEALAREPRYALRCFPAEAPEAAAWTQLASGAATGALVQRVQMLRIIAALFASELQQPLPPSQTPLSVQQKLRLLLNQLSESQFLQLQPRDLAAHCRTSTRHVHRVFRKLFGRSLEERQEWVRLQRAQHLLAETPQSLQAVAREAGFRDARSFSAAFKRQFGLPPGQWRRPRSHNGKASG
jgi:AraC-like DNA-binding protein